MTVDRMNECRLTRQLEPFNDYIRSYSYRLCPPAGIDRREHNDGARVIGPAFAKANGVIVQFTVGRANGMGGGSIRIHE